MAEMCRVDEDLAAGLRFEGLLGFEAQLVRLGVRTAADVLVLQVEDFEWGHIMSVPRVKIQGLAARLTRALRSDHPSASVWADVLEALVRLRRVDVVRVLPHAHVHRRTIPPTVRQLHLSHTHSVRHSTRAHELDPWTRRAGPW